MFFECSFLSCDMFWFSFISLWINENFMSQFHPSIDGEYLFSPGLIKNLHVYDSKRFPLIFYLLAAAALVAAMAQIMARVAFIINER